MTFSDSGHHSKIELTPEEMLTISREISFKFSPTKTSLVNKGKLLSDSYPSFNPPSVNDEKNAESIPEVFCQHGFSFKELNDISQEISRRFAPKTSTLDPEINLLPVDPLHLYIYWNTGENKAHFTHNKGLDNGLTLRIYWRPDEKPETHRSNVWFNLPADNPQCRQKVRLPIDGTAYSATLGILNADNSFDPIAHSNIIQVPPLPGRIRKAPSPNHRSTPLPVSKPDQVFDTSKRASFEAGKVISEGPQSGRRHQETVYEIRKEGPLLSGQGWFVKLHFGEPSAYHDDSSKTNAEFMAFFNKKGINIELIPEYLFVEYEYSAYHGKNASGLGM